MEKNSVIYKEKSKDRLKKIIDKKFLTTTIYPLSQFENAFGKLWGHGKPEGSLTQEEKTYRKLWNDCRNDILNNGNHQRRNAMSEIDMNEIKWLRYTTVFKPVKEIKQVSKE